MPATAWQRLAKTGIYAPGPQEAVWVRVTLRNPQRHPQRGVLTNSYRWVDRIEAWTPSTGPEQLEDGEAWTRAVRVVAFGENVARTMPLADVLMAQ